MKRALFSLVPILLTVGCATQPAKPWYKDGTSEEQFRRDNLTCRQYGMQSATTNGLGGNMFDEIWIRDEAAKCLQGLGYRQ